MRLYSLIGVTLKTSSTKQSLIRYDYVFLLSNGLRQGIDKECHMISLVDLQKSDDRFVFPNNWTITLS